MSSEKLPRLPENGSEMVPPNSQVIMTFGPAGFFGYGPFCAAPNTVWSEDSIGKKIARPYGSQGMWWSRSKRDDPDTKGVDDADIRRELLQRHSGWKDPVIQHLIKEADIAIKIATWITPKLPTWASDRVVLIGDAAHGE